MYTSGRSTMSMNFLIEARVYATIAFANMLVSQRTLNNNDGTCGLDELTVIRFCFSLRIRNLECTYVTTTFVTLTTFVTSTNFVRITATFCHNGSHIFCDSKFSGHLFCPTHQPLLSNQAVELEG